jgi:colicin import membrane protein
MAAKESKKKGSAGPRRTKDETQQEFSAIQREVEDAQEASDAKAAEVIRLREDHVRQAVEGVGVEAVVQRISGLGLEVSRALAQVSEKLTEEVRLLSTVREAVALERGELERLHKIDVAATALDHLVQDYAREKERLDAEMTAQRHAWDEETTGLERERKEQEESLKKLRQREIEDYEYRKNLERKKAQDKYEEELRARDMKNREHQEALEKIWQIREAALKEQEEELARLKKEVEAFPARLQKEIEATALQTRKEVEARLEHQMVLAKKDAEAEKRLAELRAKTLEEALTRNTAYIATLEKQLAEAKQQVQDIAVKAIEGASGARALSHINQIAMEQAKNRPQG